MVDRPKRRKKMDNPYNLKIINNNYYIIFKSNNKYNEVEVTKEVFDLMNRFELDDLKELNEFDRHIEHSEIYEDNLVIRAKEKTISMEDEFIQKATFEELKRAIEMLPEIQKRRIKKYYFEDKNEYRIAEEEHATHQSVHIVLERGIKNLKKILKNFN